MLIGVVVSELCFDLIGVDVLYGDVMLVVCGELVEVCVWVVGCVVNVVEVVWIGNEVEMFYMNGLVGGGGVFKLMCEVIVV